MLRWLSAADNEAFAAQIGPSLAQADALRSSIFWAYYAFSIKRKAAINFF